MLEIEAVLGSTWASGLGRPTERFDHPGGELFALAGHLDLLYWPGRAIYTGHRLRHPLMLFRTADCTRIARLDAARWPIQDVAFHPSAPIAAVATGHYDGGHFFEGELLVWNWETGRVTRPLGEEREVVRCRFEDTSRLVVLLRPSSEDDIEGDEDPFTTYRSVTLTDLRDACEVGVTGGSDPRLRGLGSVEPAALGFATPSDVRPGEAIEEELVGLGHVARQRTWDVRWIDRARIAAVNDRHHVELWDPRGARLLHVAGAAGHGVQILPGAAGAAWVHVLARDGSGGRVSQLHELGRDALQLLRAFDRAYSFSTGAGGGLLARDTRYASDGTRADLVLDARARTLRELDLGHFDCFNHALRLDGGEGYFFLRGSPPSSHQRKCLCRVDAGGRVAEVMAWDPAGPHLMESSARICGRRAILRGYRIHDGRPSVHPSFVERVSLDDGGTAWRCAIEAPPVAMCHVPDAGVAVVATLDGRVRVIEAETGEVRADTALVVEGLPTVVTALDVCADRVAAGTLDGRVIVWRVQRVGAG